MSLLSRLFRTETKAVSSSATEQSLMDAITKALTGSAVKTTWSAEDLVKMNTGWVFVSNNRNASCMAGTPLKLYYGKPTADYKTSFKSRALPPWEAKSALEGAPRRILARAEGGPVEIVEHPFLDLMNSVNPVMNHTDLAYLVDSYLGLIGNAYVLMRDDGESGMELWPLLSEYVIPNVTRDAIPRTVSYRYYIPNQQIDQTFPAEQVLRFANWSPGSMVVGRGDLEGCVMAAQRYGYYDSAESYLNLNQARPDFLVSYNGRYSEAELKEAVRAWNRKFSTASGSNQNSGKPMIATGDVKVTPLGLAPREMSWPNGREWAKKEICSSFGVPLALIDITDVNLASAKAAVSQYQRFTLFPKLSRYCETLNQSLLPKWDPNLWVWFDDRTDDVKSEQVSNASTFYEKGIIDRNEARAMIGLDPVEDVDAPEEPEESSTQEPE